MYEKLLQEKDMDDEKLVTLIKHNPSKGMAAAIEQYGPLVKTVIVRIIGYEKQQDAEECVSDVFVEIWKSIDNYNPDKGLLKNYIISIARHVGLNAYRRKIMTNELMPLDENLEDMDWPDMTNELSRTLNETIIRETINNLPYPDREIFLRRYYLFEPVKEIAASLELSPKAVENKLYRCKAGIRKELLNKGIIL